ncbi:MAG: hypothetical protein ACUZ8E_03030 [Candidatus Anammoxibacter sp.]
MKEVKALIMLCMLMCSLVANVFAQTTETTTTTIAPDTTTSTTTTTTSTTIPEVCQLTVLAAEVGFRNDPEDDNAVFDQARIRGIFTGITFNNDVDVAVTIGSSLITITSGTFVQVEEEDGWKFEGDISGSDVRMRIGGNTEDDSSFRFEYEVRNIDLSGTANPLSVMIAIGDNSCDTEVRLNGKLQFRSDDDGGGGGGFDADGDIAIDCEEDSNIFITGCNTGVPAAIAEGDLCEEIQECAIDAKNHGQFVSCVLRNTRNFRTEGIIRIRDSISILLCATGSDIGKKREDREDDDSSDDDSSDDGSSDDGSSDEDE